MHRTQPQTNAEGRHVDGSVARNHPHLFLFRKAMPEEADDVRVGLLLYYDEVEVCNPLGTARGKHKIGAFYYSILNLNLPSRLRASRSGVQVFAWPSTNRTSEMERLAFFVA
mmetsp:Transcript_2699/g.9047  ORF Transcript_2699/g.9047 Transcript_2699/m.9047 type:complete len:112 (-) Transcript_2699:541-876(-)